MVAKFQICLILLLMLSLYATNACSKPDAVPVAVISQPVSELVFFPLHRASAVVEALNDSRISAEITATISAIPVRVGQLVDKGSELVRLDCTDYELMLERQQASSQSLAARFGFAEYQFNRAKKLSKQQAVSEEVLKQRETDLAVLKADQKGQQVMLRQARKDVDHCLVRAPFDAIVLERLAQVGEFASPGTVLLRIIDAREREVSAKLQQHQVVSLESAQSIELVVRDEHFALSLRAITPAVDVRERSREVRLLFKEQAALPGTAGEIQWQTRQPHLPADLLVRRNDVLGVFVLNNNKAEFYPLQSAVEGRPAAVDMPGDQRVITQGRFGLKPGDIVSTK